MARRPPATDVSECCLLSVCLPAVYCLSICLLSTVYCLLSTVHCLLLPVSVKQNTPFAQALALQSHSRNCNPAPDLVLWKLMFQCVLFSRGVFFFSHRHRYQSIYLLSTVYYLLSTVYCLLSTVYCLLTTVYCYLLSPISYPLFALHYLLSAIYYLLSTLCYLLPAICYLLSTIRCY